MRARYNGQDGELTIEQCTLLRYNENGKIRKFYQQMLVAFGPDGQPAIFWSVSNWGPGSEAPWTNTGDLKGGIKSELGSSYMAEQANKRQVASKTKGGYTFYSEFNAAANVIPPPKLLAELGISRILAPRPGTKTSTPRTVPAPIVAANVRWQPLNDLRATMRELSSIAMHSLMVGDLPATIAERQTLIDLMSEIRALHETGEGQLEMLTLKLAAELKK